MLVKCSAGICRKVSAGFRYSVEKVKHYESTEIPAGYTVIAIAGVYALSNLIRIIISVILQKFIYQYVGSVHTGSYPVAGCGVRCTDTL